MRFLKIDFFFNQLIFELMQMFLSEMLYCVGSRCQNNREFQELSTFERLKLLLSKMIPKYKLENFKQFKNSFND